MSVFLAWACRSEKGLIPLVHAAPANEPVPLSRDPLALLGDLSGLCLTPAQRDDLAALVAAEIRQRGPLAVWRERALIKNILAACGVPDAPACGLAEEAEGQTVPAPGAAVG